MTWSNSSSALSLSAGGSPRISQSNPSYIKVRIARSVPLRVLRIRINTAFLSLFVSTAGLAQTNLSITTNLLTAHPSFREVDGHLYNVERSYKFPPFKGECVAILTNGIILQKIEQRTLYRPRTPHSDRLTSAGNFLGSSANASTPVPLETEEIPGEKIFIKNFPMKPYLTTGSRQNGEAMLVGTFAFGAEVLEMYDYGTPHIVQVLRTNKVISPKITMP